MTVEIQISFPAGCVYLPSSHSSASTSKKTRGMSQPPGAPGGAVPGAYPQNQPHQHSLPPVYAGPTQQQQPQQQAIGVPPPATPASRPQTISTQQQQQQGKPYHLQHAQLSPAIGDAPAASEPASNETPAAESLKTKLQHLFQRSIASSSSEEKVRNLGFTPTSRMAQQHEKNNQAAAAQQQLRPRFQFQVTKLRSWRTGYARLLALYETEFATLDPTTSEKTETNRWPYSALTDWQAVDADSILLQVGADKLKFSCHGVPRSKVLTALLHCQDMAIGGNNPAAAVFTQVQRYTRHGTTVPVQLHVKSHGLVEVNPQTRRPLQTYQYTDMRGVSLTTTTTSDQQQQGVVLRFWQPHKSRLYLLTSAHTRADLIRRLHQHALPLGLEIPMLESQKTETPAAWLQQRRQVPIGAIATCWSVRKTTPRHEVVTRQLAVTAAGYLVELDDGGAGVVSCRLLSDLTGLILGLADTVTCEFRDGARRTYASSHRDALLVSLWDAAGSHVHVSDVPSDGYCLASPHHQHSPKETAASTTTASLFQPISIPSYALQRVYALSTQAYAYVSPVLETLRETAMAAKMTSDLVQECRALLEACREFNASVLPTGEGLPTGPADKTVAGSLGALWGLVAGLLTDAQKNDVRDEAVATLLQTVYRLSRTLTGYKVSAELTTLQEAMPLLFRVQAEFGRFWAMEVLDVLLSGLPEQRDLESEYVNKQVLLRCGGSAVVQGVVSSLVEQQQPKRVSDLILMAASNVLQSVLCSFHDTTSAENFGIFIQALAERYVGCQR